MALSNRNFSGFAGITEDQVSIVTGLYDWWKHHSSGQIGMNPMAELEIGVYQVILPVDGGIFNNLWNDILEAWEETFKDIITHGEQLREFIRTRSTDSKLRLQMIDAVVVGDIDRIKHRWEDLLEFTDSYGGYGHYYLPLTSAWSVYAAMPPWTFNPSLLEVYTPTYATTQLISTQPALTSEEIQNMIIIGAKIEIQQAQSLPEEQKNAIVQAAQEKIETAIESGGTISADDELTQEMVNTYSASQPVVSGDISTSLASFGTWGWFIIGGVAVSVIVSSLIGKKGKGSKKR